jgi:AcrR family transcriptional regulator
VLQTAARLFYRDGIRAVGVDTIIAESGVAKMTLYRHFPAKDDLIVAYLEQAHEQFTTWLEEAIAPYVDDPTGALEAIFDATAKLATSPGCLGCGFLGTAAEFPDAAHPAHLKAMEHKQAVMARLAGLARAAGSEDPHGLAGQLMLLMDGAWAAARMFGPGSHASAAARAARAIIAASIGARMRSKPRGANSG